MSKDAWQMGWEKGKLPLVTQGKQGAALEQQAGIGASAVLKSAGTKSPGLAKGSKVGRGFADLN